MDMWRGSTPTLAFRFPFKTEDINALTLKCNQLGTTKISKSLTDFEESGEYILYTLLTQADTLALTGSDYVTMQFKVQFDNNHVVPSSFMKMAVNDVLDTVVMSGTATLDEPTFAIDVPFPEVDGAFSVEMGMAVSSGGGSGTSDFDALTNRPKYNGSTMTHSTNIPEVKTATWDAKANTSDIPTKTSDLTNDSGFLTSHQSLSAYRTSQAQDVIDATKLTTPSGGSTGQVIKKTANGIEWSSERDSNVFCINILSYGETLEEEGTYAAIITTDKTIEQITSAFNAGKLLMVKVNWEAEDVVGDVYLTYVESGIFYFEVQNQTMPKYISINISDGSNMIVCSGSYNLTNNDIVQTINSSSPNYYVPSSKAVYQYHDATKQNAITNDNKLSYSLISGTPTIPTVPSALSGFTDDLGSSPVHTHSQYLTSHQDISGKENTSNKVTSVSSSSTDTEYPSAKCLYDLVGNVETLLEALL